MPESQSAADIRVPWLDGLRGVAIVMVMAAHLTLLTTATAPTRFDATARLIAFGGAGWAGVDLFFVLSGMLITGILLDTRGSLGYWRRFYLRRVLRIFPLYYAFLAVVLVVAPLLYATHPAQVAELRHGVAWFSIYQTNIWIALRGGQNIDIFGTIHLWSLSVEEQFYFVWPMVVLALTRRALTYLCLALIVLAAGLRVVMTADGLHPMVIYTATPTRCDTLAIGALLAIAVREPNIMAAMHRYGRTILAVSAALILFVCVTQGGLGNQNRMVQVVGLTPIALFMGAVTADGFRGGTLARALARSPLTWLGRYSYGLYLLHWPISTWMARELRLPYRFSTAGIPEPIADPFFWLIAAAVSLAAAWASWHLFEKHFLKLKRYVRYDRDVRAAPLAPVPNDALREAA